MKLIVQIPCYNEEQTLPQTVADIPRKIAGIETVEVLIIDDGSTDRTVEAAQAAGVDHIIRNKRNLGLAWTFRRGLDACLKNGADIIVNTDGDNQYDGREIPRLVKPLIDGEADMAVGDRNPGALQHFSLIKRWLQRFGSWTMRRLSGTEVADSTSGFRAYTREAALRINVINDFTYTLETLIQAGKRRLRIADVPIAARHTPRRSRLAPTMAHYLGNAGSAMARAYAMYQPMKVFFVIGGLFLLAAFAIGLRFLVFWWQGQGTGNVQSLILAAILSIIGFQTMSLGLIADLMGANRKILEELLYRVRRRDAAERLRPSVRDIPGVLLPPRTGTGEGEQER